ncbi:hypothetical protein D3C83_05880 [compost metagenome]
MQEIPAARRGNRELQFLHSRGQPVIPARDAGLDTEDEVALLVREQRQAACRKRADESRQHQQA